MTYPDISLTRKTPMPEQPTPKTGTTQDEPLTPAPDPETPGKRTRRIGTTRPTTTRKL